MEDSFDELYDFLLETLEKQLANTIDLFRWSLKRYKVCQPHVWGYSNVNGSLERRRGEYRVGFEMFVTQPRNDAGNRTLITIDSMESLLEEADR